MASAANSTAPTRAGGGYRWLQLLFGVICMMMIANLQYGWTLFVNPIDEKFHWGRAAIQVAFAIFVFTETWLVPVEAWFVDRYGPAVVVFFGGIMVAIAWVMNSCADSLAMLYAAAVIGGIGASAVYGTSVGNALKWFPDRRGLAAGITAAGFGAGAALTTLPIISMIEKSGYQAAFFNFGIGQGLVILVLSLFLRKPPAGLPAPVRKGAVQTRTDYAPGQVLRTPVFWLLYVMMVLVAAGGVFITSNVDSIAKDFHIRDVLVSPLAWLGLGALATIKWAVPLERIFDGFGRPFFGWLSDRIGRENTMFMAFTIGAVALITLAQFGTTPIVFVFVSAIYFGVFGEIYSLFPATSGDTFGSKFATTNNGMLYTAKGTAALLVPLGTLLSQNYGWTTVFYVFACTNVLAALLAMLVLKPMRRSFVSNSTTAPAGASAQAAVS